MVNVGQLSGRKMVGQQEEEEESIQEVTCLCGEQGKEGKGVFFVVLFVFYDKKQSV